MPDTSPPTHTMLDTAEAAVYLRLSPATLISWRSKRRGPPYVKMEGRVLYVQHELDAWLASSSVNPRTQV
jgi:predicted DNA-binding transcriptional regulator AlpA